MSLNIFYEANSCLVDASPDCSLTELAFSVESGIDNFLGRGVHRFEITRTKDDEGCHLLMNGLMPTGPMLFSKVVAIGNVVKQDLFPIFIKESFLSERGFLVAKEGQHRHNSPTPIGKKVADGLTTSVVETGAFNSDLPLAHISYGLSDMFTGLFALNVKYIKWQGSLSGCQIYFKHNLTDKRISEYFLSKGPDYEITAKVSSLK